jgi:uncharacterized membrane protein
VPQVSFADGSDLRSHAAGALRVSVVFWFLTAVAGQWTFVYYIAGFYGRPTLQGDFAAWDRNSGLTDGYIAGDAIGNLFFAAHVMLAAVLTFGGALQLIPQIREHAIAFHRWNGRVFLSAAVAAALAGLYLQWIRGTGLRAPTGLAATLGTTLSGVLILAFAALAWRAVRAGNIDAHQRWATRLFLVVNGVWFLRVGFNAWMLSTRGALGTQTFFTIWSFGCYLLPLFVYQCYRHARMRGDAREQYTMAAGLVLLTLLIGAGVARAFLYRWLPLL